MLVRLWLWLFYRKGWLIGPFVRGERLSKGLPWRPDKTATGWRIDGSEPHYVTKDCKGLSGSIMVRYRASGWTAVEGGTPGLSLHFQRKGDDWSGAGRYETHRWYSSELFPLDGQHRITVPLDGDHWKAVMGSTGLTKPESFKAAKREACRVGVCFGARNGRGHGARGGSFELLAFEVLP